MLKTPEEHRAIQARAREWARVLKLPFRQQRWRGQAGEFSGTGVGSSLDFQDHRVYLPGDDPRQINWHAYARTGTYTMKQYREEVRPLVDVVLDVSASMFAYPAKAERVLELFWFGIESALQASASVRCLGVSGREHRLLELEALRSPDWLEQLRALKSSAEAAELSRLPWRAGSMRLFISDLLFPAEPERLLAPLSARQGRGIVLAPQVRQESAPDWQGNYEFVDAETSQPHEHRVEADLMSRYLSAYTRHFELWKHAAAKNGIALARIDADADFLTALRAEGIAVNAVELG